MPVFVNMARIDIKVAGAPMSEEDYQLLIECTVDQSMGAPDVITLRFFDDDLVIANGTTYDLGKEIEVKLSDGSIDPELVTKCEIFSVEPVFNAEQETETVIRAFHKMNRLHHGRKTRTFLDQKDSQYASTIAGDCGLSAEVDATTTTYPYMVQWNQTDMEFLRERARRIGYLVYTDATKLYFKKYDLTSAPVLTLTPDNGLGSFRPRFTLAQQVAKVKVRKWDPQTKAALEGVGTPPGDVGQGGVSMTGAAAVNSAYGDSVLSIVDPTALDQADLEVVANGYLAQRNREYLEAEATCPGTAKLRPGEYVTIDDVGTRYSGKYLITSASHIFSLGRYGTSITMSGGYPERIGGLLGNEQASQKVFGVVPAVVTNLGDPDNKGRIKVAFKQMPQNNGVDLESGWMRMATPMTGNGRGFEFFPEVADEVLVAFEGGDPTQGVIIGSLWNGQDTPPIAISEVLDGSKVKKRTIKSNAGHEITFGEDDGSDLSVLIKDVKGNEVLLDSKNEIVKITAQKDMTIDVTGNLTIKAQGEISVEATKNLALKATQNVNIQATQDATLKGLNITIDAQVGATVKAAAKLELSASGVAELKGAMVKIN